MYIFTVYIESSFTYWTSSTTVGHYYCSYYSIASIIVVTPMGLLLIMLLLLLLLLLFLTFNVLVANPEKLLYTVANPARRLLNSEKRRK